MPCLDEHDELPYVSLVSCTKRYNNTAPPHIYTSTHLEVGIRTTNPKVINWLPHMTRSMSGENRQLVADEPVEFEKLPVEVQACRKFTDHFRGIYRIYLQLMKKNRKLSTCNRSDLKTLGSWVLTRHAQILPEHWTQYSQCGHSQMHSHISSRWIGSRTASSS